MEILVKGADLIPIVDFYFRRYGGSYIGGTYLIPIVDFYFRRFRWCGESKQEFNSYSRFLLS